MQAIDTPSSVVGNVHNVVTSGFHGFLRYISPDTKNFPRKQLRAAEAASILSVPGTGIGMVFENDPTSVDYFQEGKGTDDANVAIANAAAAGAPKTAPIFFAVDYDATTDNIQGPILTYFQEVHAAMDAAGILTGIYGSGEACEAMKQAGVAHFTWLAQSRGWSGFLKWKPKADIIQGPGATVAGLDVDTDFVVNEAVLWTA